MNWLGEGAGVNRRKGLRSGIEELWMGFTKFYDSAVVGGVQEDKEEEAVIILSSGLSVHRHTYFGPI